MVLAFLALLGLLALPGPNPGLAAGTGATCAARCEGANSTRGADARRLPSRVATLEPRRNDSRQLGHLDRLGQLSEPEAEVPATGWFTDVPLLPIVFATSPSLQDGACKRQAARFLRELHNGTLWAVKMYDASTKYPNGIVNGHTRHVGNFDECYELRIPPPETRHGEGDAPGRYCLVDVEYRRDSDLELPSKGPFTLEFDPNDSAWEAIREKGDFRRVKRYMIQGALCVPSACSAADIEAALQEPLGRIAASRGIRLRTSVDPILCQSRDEAPRFTRGSAVYGLIVLALFALVTIGTLCDAPSDRDDDPGTSVGRKLLSCFSARRNLASVFTVNYNHPGLDCIHLMRFFFTSLVVLGHRSFQNHINSINNADYYEKVCSYPLTALFLNGATVVDAFLAMGGLLGTYFDLHELDKRGRFDVPSRILLRFLRVTPAYAMVIFFDILVLPVLGSGPLWKSYVLKERDNCANYWWANILFLNNYVGEQNMCLFQSWYLSADFQLFLLSLPIVYIFWQLPRKYGYGFLGVAIAASCVAPFVLSYSYNVSPIFVGLPHMRELLNVEYFYKYYVKSHLRITSYLVGVLTGAILYDFKGIKWRLPKVWSQISFMVLVVALSVTTQAIGHKYFDPNKLPGRLEAALYASFHKCAFVVAMCAAPILFTIGDGLTVPSFPPKIMRLSFRVPVQFLHASLGATVGQINVRRLPRARHQPSVLHGSRSNCQDRYRTRTGI
ncbi:nose resistant to fluoxetine protein 6 isoform X2 [Orussus abietinus]|uniref:nose resistant to fluoxetine protein 6 isoform X2 n=1 Tax=Orussus abietinus TaxID=222816 RepID=UPI000625936A|nr:nose resistant to fluoxetine protein 6 isoform X2 [Orussus abietinus]